MDYLKNAYDNLVKGIKFRNDFETPIFKKWFVVYGAKLYSYRIKYPSILSQLQQERKENKKICDELIKLNETLTEDHSVKLNDLKTQHERQTHDQLIKYNNLSLLFEKQESLNIELEKEILNLNEQQIELEMNLSLLTNLKNEQDIAIMELNKTILNLQNMQKALELMNKEKDNEIIRINDIKWYQKLIGKK